MPIVAQLAIRVAAPMVTVLVVDKIQTASWNNRTMTKKNVNTGRIPRRVVPNYTY